MDKLISDEYLAQNAQLHKQNARFGAKGHKWADRVIECVKESGVGSYLDYGCGKGQLADAVLSRLHRSVSVSRYDPVTNPERPAPAAFVTCMDVLEHIEPELLDNVLADLRSLTRVRGMFVISLVPSDKKLPDGRNAHLIVETDDWWLDRLHKHFSTVMVQPVYNEKKVNRELVVLVNP